MNRMQCIVVADSVSNDGKRITTAHLRYPRIIHSELMTHRVFSRNARSSRAVPVQKMLAEVRDFPFVPWHWGRNQPGMQAGEEHDAPVGAFINSPLLPSTVSREEAWLAARDQALLAAQAFMDAGYHKQVANRLLEPFTYIDTLVTSTSWANFFHLRDHEAAEPHFHDLASMTKSAFATSSPRVLNFGEWHLPYVTEKDRETYNLETLKKLSVARCARISYAPFDGDPSIERELQRYDLLVGSEPLHASPAEHQATPDFWTPDRMPDEYGDFKPGHWSQPYLHGNLEGWKQYRKFLIGEFVPD